MSSAIGLLPTAIFSIAGAPSYWCEIANFGDRSKE